MAAGDQAMTDRRSFWDGLAFGFTASVVTWQDLPPAAVVLVLAALLGAATVTVASKRGAR
jgi:hypothetical protein